MSQDMIDVPIYLITGFLESGKTTFLNFTMRQDYFRTTERTLLLVCEEGEEECDERDLMRYNTYVETFWEPEELTSRALKRLQREYKPARVIMEYNPLWSVDKLYQMKMPAGWGIVQEIVVVDTSTFQIYMNNMKSLFVEMARPADMVLFNRCEEDLPLANFRRSVKVVNPGADVQFVGSDNHPVDLFEDSVPYDVSGDEIVIDDIDYGIFFVDMRDHPDRYRGKTVTFKGKVLKSRELDADIFMPARPAMTCCADDIQYIGYLCHSQYAPRLTEGSWVTVTAKVAWEYVDMAEEEEPVLYAQKIDSTTAPESELVYFN